MPVYFKTEKEIAMAFDQADIQKEEGRYPYTFISYHYQSLGYKRVFGIDFHLSSDLKDQNAMTTEQIQTLFETSKFVQV